MDSVPRPLADATTLVHKSEQEDGDSPNSANDSCCAQKNDAISSLKNLDSRNFWGAKDQI